MKTQTVYTKRVGYITNIYHAVSQQQVETAVSELFQEFPEVTVGFFAGDPSLAPHVIVKSLDKEMTDKFSDRVESILDLHGDIELLDNSWL